MPITDTKSYLDQLLLGAEALTIRPEATGDFAPLDPLLSSASIVAGILDVSGDGIADIVIGAPGDDDKATDAGRIFVLSGATAGGTSGGIASTGTLMIIDGIVAGDRAGAAVGSIGDLNADGKGDILIGAPGSDIGTATDAGAAYVIWGGAGGVDLGDPFGGGGKGFVMKGETAGDAAGTTVAAIADLNGDGKADILVGAPGQDAGGSDAGAVYVVWGKTGSSVVSLGSVASGTGGFKIVGASAGDLAGSAIGSVGDLNGDGKAEILVGTSASQAGGLDSGAVYVVFGKASGTSVDLNAVAAGTGGFVIKGAAGDLAGASVSGIGDVNGDGKADILIAAPGSDSAYVVFGKSDTLAVDLNDVRSGIGGFQILAESAGDLAGMSVTGGKDLNHDGIADIVIGAPHNGEGGTDAGAVYLVWGGGHSTVDLSVVAQSMGGAKIVGTAGSLTGMSVALTGDLNADGSADLLISAPGAGESAWVVHSQASWQPDTNVYGTNGDDLIGAGYGANHLVGEGADNILALDGNDTVATGGGNDTIDGGTGDDSMAGGAGDDTYYVDSWGDTVTENADEGTDTVIASVDHVLGDNVENLQLVGWGLSGTGNDLANTITGTDGNDTLDGGAGADTLSGGLGDDSYGVDNAGDVVVEGAGGGNDTVYAAIDYALGANVENLVLTGLGQHGTGNELDNAITGSAGNDTIDGAAGADSAAGGLGDDTYLVDNAGDVVSEAAGEGSDTVIASVDYTLTAGSEIENLVLTGSAHSGTGNAFANAITGSDGNDTLDGGAGADTLSGGLGDDTYHVDNAGDVIVEAANGGTDTVIAASDYTLAEGSNVENLTLADGGHAGTGNSNANLITGGSGADTLSGGGGADTLTGGAGDDHYVIDSAGVTIVENAGGGTDTVHAGIDFSLEGLANVENLTLTGGAHHGTGNDLNNVLTGGTGADVLEGGLGNDTFHGGGGADTFVGGAGDDTFYIDNPNDVVIEGVGGGNDTVIISSDWTLADNIENVVLVGSGHTLTGNAGNNTLSGDTGNDILDGGAGDDTEIGGDGNDTLISGSGHDTLAGGAGDDVYKIHGGATHIEDFQGHDTIDASEATGDSHIDLSGDTVTEIEHQVCDFGTGGTVTGALNVQFLQDLTGSFADDIANVRTLVPQIVTALNGVSGGAAFGVSSFRDKVYGAFGSFGDWVYRTDLAMGSTALTLTNTYAGFVASGGNDLPEAQLEALMQLALRATSEVGFQNNSARFVVLFTDAPFHTAADGLAAGITVANNGDAIIDNGGILENYPEIALLKTVLAAANIIPVFAVTAGLETTYQSLATSLGRGTVVTLTANSSNIVSAITTGLTTATTTHIADAIGGAGNDTLIGNVGDNVLTGNAGNDTLTGSYGNDTLHGGDGSDTAVYSGTLADYTITNNADGTTTVADHRANGDGTDKLDGVEFLKIGGTTYTIAGAPVGTGTNTAPVIGSNGGGDTAAVSVAENSVAVTTVSATDADAGTTLTYAITGGTDAALFTIDTATGALSFKAAPNFEAPADANGDNVYDVVVSASDGSLSDSQTIAVTVTNVNEAPVLSGTQAALAAGSEDTVYTVTKAQLIAGFTDPDGDALAAAGLVADHGSFVANPDGSFTFTPDANYNGPVSFTYTVSDGHGGSLAASESFALAAVNDPASISGTATGNVVEAGSSAGTPGASGSLSVSDVDAGEAVFAAPASLAGTYGTFTFDAATGAWTYALDNAKAATQALTAGQVTSDKLTVTSLDGTASQDIVVTVTGANDAATISGTASGSVTEAGGVANGSAGTPSASGALSVSDVDAGQAVFAAPASLAGTYGSFAFDAATGAWTYTLDNTRAATQALAGGQVVTDSLTVASLDGSASQVISVTVNGANDAATIGGTASGSVLEAVGTTGTSQVSGALTISDVDSTAQFAAASVAGAYGSLTINAAGAWTYSLNNANAAVDALASGQSMTDTVTVSAADGTTKAIVITINGVNDPLTLTGTSGADRLTGSAGNDVISGLGGNDTILGNGGNDTIEGGAGNDSLDGGTGIDTVTYASATAAVTVNLSLTAAQNTGGAGKDILLNFENLIGSAFNDTLTGTSGANAINGGGGNDKITGGGGADLLTGGAGSDVFVYSALSDSTASLFDTIGDFTKGADKIDLSLIDATPGGKDNAFAFGGTTATAHGVWYAYDSSAGLTHVYGDTDGNLATAELRIDLTGSLALAATDFVL